jgi:hypothetical protein
MKNDVYASDLFSCSLLETPYSGSLLHRRVSGKESRREDLEELMDFPAFSSEWKFQVGSRQGDRLASCDVRVLLVALSSKAKLQWRAPFLLFLLLSVKFKTKSKERS